jgi:endonuclease V-like protein UPF0215 family
MGSVFMEGLGNFNGVVIINRKPEPIKRPMVVFTEGNPVVDAVIIKFRERFDMGTVYYIFLVIENLQTTESTTIAIN